MKRMAWEFEVGDLVTFKIPADADEYPVEIKIKAKVTGRGYLPFQADSDGRVAYNLEGIDKPLITTTSPLWIAESQYFGQIEEWME